VTAAPFRWNPLESYGNDDEGSNEAHELNAYRIQKFKLDGFVDTFISSCFVQHRKPDVAIFRLALDISLAPARRIVYIENTPMFVQIAEVLMGRTS
jgi:putative hydrolase of the HAD superfamily